MNQLYDELDKCPVTDLNKIEQLRDNIQDVLLELYQANDMD